MGDVGFVRGLRVHWVTPCSSFGVAGLIALHPEGCRFLSRSLGSLVRALRVVGFVRVHWGMPWVSSGSLGVAVFIGVRPWGVGFVRVIGFIGVLAGGRRVRS